MVQVDSQSDRHATSPKENSTAVIDQIISHCLSHFYGISPGAMVWWEYLRMRESERKKLRMNPTLRSARMFHTVESRVPAKGGIRTGAVRSGG